MHCLPVALKQVEGVSVFLQDEQSTPKQLKGLDDYTFTDVACGSYHTVALADRNGAPEVSCCEGLCSACATLLIVYCATRLFTIA
jgi:hypothetical protein